ncbi:MAG: hypothetical protein KAH18_04690 [Psychromonas sp.]|nr:hypothetical protein [Psychromonas sp.]
MRENKKDKRLQYTQRHWKITDRSMLIQIALSGINSDSRARKLAQSAL